MRKLIALLLVAALPALSSAFTTEEILNEVNDSGSGAMRVKIVGGSAAASSLDVDGGTEIVGTCANGNPLVNNNGDVDCSAFWTIDPTTGDIASVGAGRDFFASGIIQAGTAPTTVTNADGTVRGAAVSGNITGGADQIFISRSLVAPSNSAAQRIAVAGSSTPDDGTLVQMRVHQNLTFSKLGCSLLTDVPGAGKSWAIVLMVGNTATALTTTISDTAQTNTDTTNTVAVTGDGTFANAGLSLRITPSGTPTSSHISCTLHARPT